MNATLIESKSFSKQIGITGITKQSIINFFTYIRNILRKNMNLKWSKRLLCEDNNVI